jgi:hypothetical protein
VPVLVRPYLPWPTLDERPMPRAAHDAVRRTLPAGCAWDVVPDAFIVSDGRHAMPLWWSLAERHVSQPLRAVLTGAPLREVRG